MPYISDYDRALVDETGYAVTPGGLSYQLTKIINSYLKEKGVSYDVINTVIIELEKILYIGSRHKIIPGLTKEFRNAYDSYVNRVKVFDVQAIKEEALGAVRACQLEFYRRVAVPYENSKLALNGDVYERRESLDRADGDQK